MKAILKEKSKLQKDLSEKDEISIRNSQKIKSLQSEKEANESRLQKDLIEKENSLKNLQEKAQEYCKNQEKDFEQIKREYNKVKEENIKLKEDLAIETDKIGRIIKRNNGVSDNETQLKGELEVNNQKLKDL